MFGAFYGFAELIPYVGPAIGAAPPVLIALFSDNPLDALWLTIMFTALQQIEGHIVAPTVFSQALRINPLLVIFALLMGGRLYGIAGRLPGAAARGRGARERRVLPRAPGARAMGHADRGRAGIRARRQPSCAGASAPMSGVRHRGGRRGGVLQRLRDRARGADEAAAAASAAPS